jgi:hypothetical protein
MTIAVPERALKTSRLRTRTGRIELGTLESEPRPPEAFERIGDRLFYGLASVSENPVPDQLIQPLKGFCVDGYGDLRFGHDPTPGITMGHTKWAVKASGPVAHVIRDVPKPG